MVIFARLLLMAIFSISLVACSGVPHRVAQKQASNKLVFLQTGKASYYADKYQSRPTASGEPFDQSARTAAHKTLRFGTFARVVNLANGKSVVVRINDRGPYVRGRIIDLSKSAFQSIGDTRLGVINVGIVPLR